MDINDLRIAVTVVSLLAFVGIVAWVWPRAATGAGFDEAAQLPFADDEPTRGSLMSDFFSSGWSIFIAAGDAGRPASPAWCCSSSPAAASRWPATTAPATSGTRTCAR